MEVISHEFREGNCAVDSTRSQLCVELHLLNSPPVGSAWLRFKLLPWVQILKHASKMGCMVRVSYYDQSVQSSNLITIHP